MGLPYQTVTYTTTGTKASINLDPSIADFKVRVYVDKGAATVDYKLQYSLTPSDVADSASIWIDSTTIPASTTTSKEESFVTPISKIRLIITSVSGGTMTLQTLQGFMVG
jgi:hypothetical protein